MHQLPLSQQTKTWWKSFTGRDPVASPFSPDLPTPEDLSDAVSGPSSTHGRLPQASSVMPDPISSLDESSLDDGRTVLSVQPGRLPWLESTAERKPSPPSDLPVSMLTPVAVAGSFPGLIHDARNLVTTLELYCDLLDSPEVLQPASRHYAAELRLIALGSRHILDKLGADPSLSSASPSALDLFSNDGSAISPVTPASPRLTLPTVAPKAIPASGTTFQRISDTVDAFSRNARWSPFVSPEPIKNIADVVLSSHDLLCALAGPSITVGLSLYEAKRPVSMAADDLTRVLVNLVKNAAEAMPGGGHIQIALEEFSDHISLSVSDTGPGIAESALEMVFTAGYTTNVTAKRSDGSGWQGPQRGLGLAIVRSLVTAAGGTITAANRHDGPIALLTPDGDCAAHNSATLPVSGAVIRLRFPIGS